MSNMHFPLLDFTQPTISSLLDSILATPYPESAAVEQAPSAPDQLPPSKLISPLQALQTAEKLAAVSFAIIDIHRPLLASTTHRKPVTKPLSFPTLITSPASASPHKNQQLISRIAVAATWSESFLDHCKALNLQKLDDDSPIDQICSLICYDGQRLWSSRVTGSDCRETTLDGFKALHSALSLGRTRKQAKESKGIPQSTGEDATFTIEGTTATLQLFKTDSENTMMPLFNNEGVTFSLCEDTDANAKDSLSQKDAIAELFVLAFKQQILSQHLAATLLSNLVDLQRMADELVRETLQVVKAREDYESKYIKAFMKLLNEKKNRIRELQDQLNSKQTNLISPSPRKVLQEKPHKQDQIPSPTDNNKEDTKLSQSRTRTKRFLPKAKSVSSRKPETKKSKEQNSNNEEQEEEESDVIIDLRSSGHNEDFFSWD